MSELIYLGYHRRTRSPAGKQIGMGARVPKRIGAANDV